MTGFTWSGSNGSSGTGPLSDTIASLAPGASVTYTVVASIDPSATGSVTNTVTVTAANDTNADNNTASDTDTLTLQNDVSVTKDDGVTSVVPGATTTYTIVVSNSGPSTATSVSVSDALPAGVTGFSWSGSNGSSGTGPLSDTIASLAPGSHRHLHGGRRHRPLGHRHGHQHGDASTAANDTNPANNSASDTDTLTPQNDVRVTKTTASAAWCRARARPTPSW